MAIVIFLVLIKSLDSNKYESNKWQISPNIHTHFNCCGMIFYSKGLFLSDTIEVSYMNNKNIESFEYKSGFANIIGLDSPNLAHYPEIPVIFPLESLGDKSSHKR